MTATRSRAGFPAFHLVKRAKSRRFVTVIINGGDASEYEPRSAVGGGWLRLGSRKLAAGTRRDEVMAALMTLQQRTGVRVFTFREVYAEMIAVGTCYAESAVFIRRGTS